MAHTSFARFVFFVLLVRGTASIAVTGNAGRTGFLCSSNHRQTDELDTNSNDVTVPLKRMGQGRVCSVFLHIHGLGQGYSKVHVVLHSDHDHGSVDWTPSQRKPKRQACEIIVHVEPPSYNGQNLTMNTSRVTVSKSPFDDRR